MSVRFVQPSVVAALAITSTFSAALLVEAGMTSVTSNLLVRLGCAVLAFLFLMKILLNRQKSSIGTYNLILVLLIICLILRVLGDSGVASQLVETRTSEYLYYLIVGILVPVVVLSVSETIDERLLSKVVLAVLLVLAIVYLFNYSFLLGTDFGRLQRDLFGVNPLTVGYTGALLLNLVVANYLSKNKKTVTLLAFTASVALVAALCLAISGSRGPLLNVFFVVSILVWYKSGRTLGGKAIAISAIAVVILSALYVISSTGSLAIYRLLNTGDRIDSEREPRLELYQEVFHLISDNPWVGFSSSLPDGGYAHNIVLDIILALGIFGGAIFVSLLIVAVKRALSIIKNDGNVCVPAVFFTFLIWGMVSSNIYYLTPFWSVLALLLSAKCSADIKVDFR